MANRTWEEAVRERGARNAKAEQLETRRGYSDGIDPNEPLNHDDLLMKVLYRDSPEHKWAEAVSKKLGELADKFRISLFDAGWGVANDSMTEARIRTDFGDVKMLSIVSAGRVMMTLSRGNDNITFICAESASYSMGFQSIEASLASATSMVDDAINVWNSTPSPENLLRHDKNARVNGIY